MRQGNQFSMQIDRSFKSGPKLNVPLEVAEEFNEASYVVFIRNADGTYTLRLVTDYS